MKPFKSLNPINIIVTLTLLLGSALFVFAANIQFIEGGPHRAVSERTSSLADWANANESCYFAMYAERADGGGDLSVTGYREPRELDADGNAIMENRSQSLLSRNRRLD